MPSSPLDADIVSGQEELDMDDFSDLLTFPEAPVVPDDSELSIVEPVWRSFPFLHTHNDEEAVAKTIEKIAEALDSNNENLAQVFGHIEKWFDDVARSVNTLHADELASHASIWSIIPNFMAGLINRKEDWPREIAQDGIASLCTNFVRVTSRLLQLDVQRLQREEEVSDISNLQLLPSLKWSSVMFHLLLPVDQLCNRPKASGTKTIESSILTSSTVQCIAQQESARCLFCLSDMFDQLLRLIPAASPSRNVVLTVIQSFCALLQACNVHYDDLSPRVRLLSSKLSCHMYSRIATLFTDAITKQRPWLNIETSTNWIDVYGRIMCATAKFKPGLIDEVLASARVTTIDSKHANIMDVAFRLHRITVLKAFIQNGRMELRVLAIEMMARELVEIWQNPQLKSDTVLVQVIVEFLKQNQIAKYIFGVDPHPQIVQRSANVIGFLCVSDNWDHVDTDTAWEALLVTDDSRAVTAYFDVLKVNLQHLTASAKLYIFSKCLGLQYAQISVKMLEFIMTVLQASATQAIQKSEEVSLELRIAVLNLSLHLLREAHLPERCASTQSQDIRKQITQFLQSDYRSHIGMFLNGIPGADRDEMLGSICRDISESNKYACGSVIAMTSLLQALGTRGCREIVNRCDYINLLVDSVVALQQQNRADSSKDLKCTCMQYESRLTNLATLIICMPELFDNKMADKLWKSLLASDLPAEIRASAWQLFANTFGKLNSECILLTRIVQLFMECLPPAAFDTAVLQFVEESIKFEIHQAVRDPLSTLR